MSKKIAVQIGIVIKGILFIGFSIQIIFGIVWMCCNFVHVQDFSAPDTTLYGGMFRLLGERWPVMYFLQLTVAFLVDYFLMQSLCATERWLAVWRALALLTFPFAMQCHLAVQPHSFVSSLFLLLLTFLIRAIRGRGVRSSWFFGLICLILLIYMTGVVDKDSRTELSEKGIEGIMASRMAWSTMMNDFDYWPEELQEIAEEIHFDATIYPENMELLLEAVMEAVGPQKAREYYGAIAQNGWEKRLPVIIRQTGWDFLGYTVSPIIVPLQLAGEAYDSYTGRNYENMCNTAPILTKYYVDYSCWWFAVALVICVVGSMVLVGNRFLGKKDASVAQGNKGMKRKNILAVAVCITLSLVWVTVLSLRGAGVMDYKWTVAINQLWIVWALLLMKTDCSEVLGCKGE